VAEFMQVSIAFLVRVQCRRKESSRSLSHLLMSFLYIHQKQARSQDFTLGGDGKEAANMLFFSLQKVDDLFFFF